MDYIDQVDYRRHESWEAFRLQLPPRRLVLLTTKASLAYVDTTYRADDILMVGRESAGVPDDVHAAVDLRVTIPMQPGMRSLNVALSAAIVLGEALRQTYGFKS